MKDIWFISDTHFGDNSIYTYLHSDGTRVRPWADNANDGDAIMIERWNEWVKPFDRVYHLGDVAMPRSRLKLLASLNGKKVLIRGNHDIFKLKDYAPYFEDIRGSHKLDKYLLSHIPVHPMGLRGWVRGNIHGHIHRNKVYKHSLLPFFPKKVDDRYFNASVENIDARPIHYDSVRTFFGELSYNMV